MDKEENEEELNGLIFINRDFQNTLDSVNSIFAEPISKICSFNREIDMFSSKVNLLGTSLSPDYLSDGILKFNKSFETITKFESPLTNIEISSVLIEPLKSSSLSISKLLEPETVVELSKCFDASRSWLTDFESKTAVINSSYDELIKGSLASPILTGTSFNLNAGISKLHELGTLNDDLVNQFSVQANLGKLTELNLFSEKSLAGITLDNIGSAIGLSTESQRQLSNNINNFTESYRDIFKTFEDNPSTIFQLNPTLLTGIPTQLFTTTNLLESISLNEIEDIDAEEVKTDIIYENEISLSYYLNKLDKDLYKIWIGAKSALKTDNPDRIRHFSISVRELITHVLHSLAPTDKVKKWTDKQEHFHQGRPTRRARILFICREIRTNNFDKYVNADVNSMLEFIELFQEGAHSKSPSFTDKQLIAMRTKAEATLKFLLEIADK